MIELQGKYNTAKVFTDNAEQSALTQIMHLLNQEFLKGSRIRVMPDTHAGIGCTIGTTMTIEDKIVPNLVGVDIGCGMETVLLKDKRVELAQLDKAIHQYRFPKCRQTYRYDRMQDVYKALSRHGYATLCFFGQAS